MKMNNQARLNLYLSLEVREKLDEISIFLIKLGKKKSLSRIISDCLERQHDIIASEYFMEFPEEYPRWKEKWDKNGK